MPGAVIDLPYDQSLVATGGNGTHEWDVSSGSLPDGLTLSVEGRISGTPTTAGDFPFTAHVQSAEQTATVELSITVTEFLASIPSHSLPMSVGIQ